jgi:hypothetical protein
MEARLALQEFDQPRGQRRGQGRQAIDGKEIEADKGLLKPDSGEEEFFSVPTFHDDVVYGPEVEILVRSRAALEDDSGSGGLEFQKEGLHRLVEGFQIFEGLGHGNLPAGNYSFLEGDDQARGNKVKEYDGRSNFFFA